MMDLSAAEVDVMRQLFMNGPTWDGNIISKSGRDVLARRGYAWSYEGWTTLTISGLAAAVERGLNFEKERRDARMLAERVATSSGLLAQ